MTDGCDISSEIALRLTSQDLSDDKSTLAQVMAWCHQASSHCLNQCWPRSPPPYGVTRPQWVNSLAPRRYIILELVIQNSNMELAVQLLSGECHRTSLMRSQYWFRSMAWCCQTSHYLSQCWFRSMQTYGITGPHRVKIYMLHTAQQ